MHPADSSVPPCGFEGFAGKAKISPHVLLNILEAVQCRAVLAKEDSSPGIVVSLLGSCSESLGTIEVTDCFVNSWSYHKTQNGSNVISINRDQFEKMLALKQKQNRKEVIVGWAFTTPLTIEEAVNHHDWATQRKRLHKSESRDTLGHLHVAVDILDSGRNISVKPFLRGSSGVVFKPLICDIAPLDYVTASLLGHYTSQMFNVSDPDCTGVPLQVPVDGVLGHLNELLSLSAGFVEASAGDSGVEDPRKQDEVGRILFNNSSFPKSVSKEEVVKFRKDKLTDNGLAAFLGQLSSQMCSLAQTTSASGNAL